MVTNTRSSDGDDSGGSDISRVVVLDLVVDGPYGGGPQLVRLAA
jgi:hypothetical protein